MLHLKGCSTKYFHLDKTCKLQIKGPSRTTFLLVVFLGMLVDGVGLKKTWQEWREFLVIFILMENYLYIHNFDA